MGVHRSFYPNARAGQDPKEVKPVVKANPVLAVDGVTLDFLTQRRAFTPNELKMMARWLYSLAHEAERVAKEGLVSETQSYDVVRGKLAHRAADNKV